MVITTAFVYRGKYIGKFGKAKAMDPLTHGLLGGVLVKAAWRDKASARLTAAGAVGAMAPDLDILIHSKGNPLLFFEYHRQFTHCLAFIPIGGTLVGLLLWLFWMRRLPLRWFVLAATLGYASHGLLDACTSYGTMLLWPFSSRRVAWDIISIVDPIYSGILFLGLCLACWRPSRRGALLALGLSFLYLLGGVWQHGRAFRLQGNILQSRGETAEQRRVLPTFGNLVLWRSLYVSQGNLYVDALRVGLGRNRFWSGGSLPHFVPEQVLPPLPPDSLLAGDLRAFAWFTDGYTAVANPQPLEVGDLRFTASPNGLQSLWVVRIDPQRPEGHLSRLRLHWARSEGLKVLWEMLRGIAPEAQFLSQNP
jgi:inner membrane protein